MHGTTARSFRVKRARPVVILLLVTLVAVSGCSNSTEDSSVRPDVPDSGSVQSGPFSLEYRTEGTGRPAIVIGFPKYYSRVFSESLRSHLRFVFVDHRGSAESPGPVDRAEFELGRLADDVELVRQHLGLGPVIVIGHSGHSYMALEYAKKYPASVSHVVMIGISPDLSAVSAEARDEYWEELASPERKSALQKNELKMPDEKLSELPPGEAWIKTYVRNGPRAWFDPQFDSTPLWEGVKVNMDMFNYVWGELFRDIDVTEGLESLQRPVFLALGRYDFLIAPPSSWDPIRDSFQDVTIRVFENSGHTPQYEVPELFDQELLEWISEHGGDSPADA